MKHRSLPKLLVLVPALLLSGWLAARAPAARARQDDNATLRKKSGSEAPKPVTTAPSKRASGAGTRRAANRAKTKEAAGRLIKRDPPPPPPPAPGEIYVSVYPPDSTVSVAGSESAAVGGSFTRGGLAPGGYKLLVRREGYREKVYDVNVTSGARTPLKVDLEPISGVLTVSPSVPDAEINIMVAESGSLVGTYSGGARDVKLSPGSYVVTVSKEGYRTITRQVRMESAGSVYLEPPLEPLPRPDASSAAAPRFRPDPYTTAGASAEGKFILLSLRGRSGDTAHALGSVDVTLNVAQGGQTSVSGMLPGYPCRVEFVKLENVAEFSFVEPPGIMNQWARVVVRVRPKDSKRTMHFQINWQTVGGGPAGPPER